MKLLAKAYLVFGVIWLLASVRLTFVANMNLSLIAMYVAAIVLIIVGYSYDRYKSVFRKRRARQIGRLILIASIGVAVLSVGLYGYGVRDTVTYKEDAIIVLGAGIKGNEMSATLKGRLDAAIAYTKKNPGVFLVLSGGQGPGESVTEAEAMKDYVLANAPSIRFTQLIIENESTSTHENMVFAKKKLDERFAPGYKVGFVTSDFHVLRSNVLASFAGMKGTTHLHAEVPWYIVPGAYLRECLALAKALVLRN
jgi:uncharacterized SAM-binding protein YcdF (DUF218 family)